MARWNLLPVATGACAAAGLAVALAACTTEGTPCYPGDYIACGCDDGARGYARCAADGLAYGACDCSGKIPGVPGVTTDAGGGGAGDAGAEASGKKAFMEPCESNEECETGLCFPFNAKGPKCSKPCTAANGATECPPPSGACNNQGVCKAP